MSRTEPWTSLISQLAEAGLSGERNRLELTILKMIRSMKNDCPEVSQQLGALLSRHSVNPSGLRWKETGPPPTDQEEGFSLVKQESSDDAPEPIFPPALRTQTEQFLKERTKSAKLLQEGFTPPRSLLLTGAPGTGKTMLARWIAGQLNLPFISLDLATSISSLLGKTGFNLRRVLDYARATSSVLLLDEFDAIAKRRDDATDLGELKRTVNVLLKELENWPFHSILIAATNHPDLLDPAIRRRFDTVLNIPLPTEKERFDILERSGGRFSKIVPQKLLRAFASGLEGISPSDAESLMHAAVRRHLTNDIPMIESLTLELQDRFYGSLSGKRLGDVLRSIQSSKSESFTVRQLAKLFGKSVSTVQHHLGKESQDA